MEWAKQKRDTGFTIVELLIVVVVIAILAAITVVAYNGIQQQATNTKTTQALNDWVKILSMYKADNGRWPNYWTCLGEGYLYGQSGTDTSGTAQCRMTGTTGYTETSAFATAMRSYVGGGQLPVPSFVSAVASSTDWRRGLHYAYGGGDGTQVYIQAAYKGSIPCPNIGQGTITGGNGNYGGNTVCTYLIGTTTDT